MRISAILAAVTATMCVLMVSSAKAAVASRVATGDTFIYGSSSTAGPGGPTLSSLNFGTSSYLGVAVDRDNARPVRTLIQFDTTGLTLGVGEGAHLDIRTRTSGAVAPSVATPFNGVTVEPSPSRQVTVDIYRVTQAWGETTATYNNQPTVDPVPVSSFVVDGINKVFSADVTLLLAGWIAAPATNFGLELRQRDVVSDGQFDAAVVFDARSGSTVVAAPTLVIPEPASLATLAGIATMAVRRRRQ